MSRIFIIFNENVKHYLKSHKVLQSVKKLQSEEFLHMRKLSLWYSGELLCCCEAISDGVYGVARWVLPDSPWSLDDTLWTLDIPQVLLTNLIAKSTSTPALKKNTTHLYRTKSVGWSHFKCCVPVAQWLSIAVSSTKGCGFNSQGTHIVTKNIAWMHCKSLWIKASAKCINVNVAVRIRGLP